MGKLIKGLDHFLPMVPIQKLKNDSKVELNSLRNDVPKNACFDRFGEMFIPWNGNLYRRVNDTELILYKRGQRRKIKIKKIPNPLRHIKTTYTGIKGKNLILLRRQIKKRQKAIPIYRETNIWSFTRVIPSLPKKKIKVPPFSNLLNYSKTMNDSKKILNFESYLEKEIQTYLHDKFKFSPLQHSFYKRRTLLSTNFNEDSSERYNEDKIYLEQKFEKKKEDRIDFSFAPLSEIIRAVTSIFEINFKTSKERFKFTEFVNNVILNSSNFSIKQIEYNLGYGDILFVDCSTYAQCYFSIWKQKRGERSNIKLGSNLCYFHGSNKKYYFDQDHGEMIYIQGNIEGMEVYYKVVIKMVKLKVKR